MKKYINNIFLISVLLLCILAIINIVHTYNKAEQGYLGYATINMLLLGGLCICFRDKYK